MLVFFSLFHFRNAKNFKSNGIFAYIYFFFSYFSRYTQVIYIFSLSFYVHLFSACLLFFCCSLNCLVRAQNFKSLCHTITRKKNIWNFHTHTLFEKWREKKIVVWKLLNAFLVSIKRCIHCRCDYVEIFAFHFDSI